MKKISLLFLLLISGCVYAGDYDVIDSRKNFFAAVNGYSVTPRDQEPKLVKAEYINEKNYKLNQSMTAFRGYSALNDKTYRRDVYQRTFLKPNMAGALNSGSVPYKFKPDDQFKIIGEVRIDGQRFRLAPTDLDEFVFLIHDDGRIYDKMGKLVGGNLVLMDPVFESFPAGLRMVEVASSRSEQTKPTKGFDVKYDGVKMDRVWFTYLDYSQGQGDKGSFENISFPNKPGLIEINGIGFRILHADNDRLDYMVLRDGTQN